MQYYTKHHKYTCGIDLHARILYVCVMDSESNILLHQSVKANPEALLKLLNPYLEDLVVGVECMFSWYWVADFCHDNGIECVLGHALYMKAIHGGKAKNDKIDSEKITRLLQCKMFPKAYVYPRELRGTRDLMRRRMGLMRERAQLISHVQNTLTQYNLPTKFTDIRAVKYHEDIINQFDEFGVKLSIELDLQRIAFYNQKLDKLEAVLKKQAAKFDLESITLLQSINGVGTILSMVILYEIHSIDRFDSVQDFASYCRLIKCQRESAGKNYGTAGAKIGNAYLRWAFGEAAILFLRGNPEAQSWLSKKTNKYNKAKALTLLSHKLGRAVYFMLKRKKVFNQDKFLGTA